jgi:AcrR family transcriptional regulator
VAGSDKKAAIVEAAGELFLKHGLRGTSMEAIARTAKIAKPTLYAYFPDKEAVFRALVERLVADWRSAFIEGLRGEGDVVARVGAALTAKYKAMMRLLEGCPHAEELYGEQDRTAAKIAAAFEAELAGAVEHELQLSGVARPRLLAQLLMAAVGGVSQKAQSPAELGPAIRLLTERLIRPELPAS